MHRLALLVRVWAAVMGLVFLGAHLSSYAVDHAPRVAVVASRYDLVVLDYHAAVVASEACRPSRDCRCYPYVVLVLARSPNVHLDLSVTLLDNLDSGWVDIPSYSSSDLRCHLVHSRICLLHPAQTASSGTSQPWRCLLRTCPCTEHGSGTSKLRTCSKP